MAEIVGTITNLSDFLSKTQVCLSVKPNDPQQQIICLEADRKYSIPAFQREVRWDDNNLTVLLPAIADHGSGRQFVDPVFHQRHRLTS